jgi:iron complex outermembrane receptor protein
MDMVSRNSSPRLLVVAIAAALATPAVAAPVLEEIVVTAQKREQTLQEIPVAVSAFSGDFIAEANVTDPRSRGPHAELQRQDRDSFIDALAIRGIVTNDFGMAATPQSRSSTAWAGRNGGVQMNYDIERRGGKGPQATLFGQRDRRRRGIITKKPAGVRGRLSTGTPSTASRGPRHDQRAAERQVVLARQRAG